MLALAITLVLAGAGGAGLAFWRGFNAGYTAALAYRKVAADVEAATIPVDDTTTVKGGAR
jgi:hypothetical protein